MTTLVPRQFYSPEELEKLYPKELELQLVQITGLPPYWPYCNSARQLTSVILNTKDFSKWDQLKYRRRLETFGMNDGPVIASGPLGEFDAICQPGELTDKGRQTTLALGERLRHLYINTLEFMPKLISSSDMIYLRATPVPRALESVQQAFWGFYPPSARTADFPPPTIITRTPADETLFPNDASCRRFAQLSRAFAQRAAEKWNDTDDMRYLSKKLSKWMPGEQDVAVDSHPRLSGIMDTLNATDAHGPETKLPKEFYDAKTRAIIDKIAVEEWYQGYAESSEYRMLGIGGLMGDITSRMIGSIERNGNSGIVEVGGNDGQLGKGRGGETDIKFAMSGCHDTTLAAVLTSLGAFQGEHWPPFSSHIAVEMFRKRDRAPTPEQTPAAPRSQGWWTSLFGSTKTLEEDPLTPEGIARKPLTELSPAQRKQLDDYYVRIRYNDKVMQIPGCKAPGKHLDGDTTFCTLTAFKSIVDTYTPRNWKQACASRLDALPFPERREWAGFE
ncbi:phosphoglycerate mutase-like protein [Decorospora gaudefroyi]|uniref:Phosphoglycerate mutase-like protein n=1 Tax=Decorospora gaudefroyi TaxID=184978 RepID=A0A6A5KQ04_9PLEO|nr:phosphoglycerate mutase-like protein [Decorospora gaudefroyi]